MEQELRFGLDLGRLAFVKKELRADYQQLLRLFFQVFMSKEKFLKTF